MNFKLIIIKGFIALCISAVSAFTIGNARPDTTIPNGDTQSKPQQETSSGVASEPTPTKPTPSKPTPSKPTPTKPTPTKPTPSKPTPSKPTPSKPTPSTPAPTKPTPSTPAPTKPTPSGEAYSAFQTRVLELVNIERGKAGLKSLSMNTNLNKVATVKSQDMADKNYFDHNSPTYGSPFDMMKQFGITYRSAGENIAMGQTTPEQVMNGWMNSPGHRANILNSSFTQIGIGIAKNSSGRLYWTQQFIG